MLDQTACHELTVLGNEMETGTGEQQLPRNSAAGSGTTHSIGKQVRMVMWAQRLWVCQGTCWFGHTLYLCLRHIQPSLA